MKLWLLESKKEFPIYDSFDAFVVRAEDEVNARVIAGFAHGDEGGAEWLDPTNSACTELTCGGMDAVILGSFNAG